MSALTIGWVPVLMVAAFASGAFVGARWTALYHNTRDAQVSETSDTDPRE